MITGAGLVTMAGRMRSLGLADLRGHVGIGFDAGAWLDSAFNGAVMFIGPFSVYLGGLLGPRRTLLFAAGSFTITCVFLPFIDADLLVALIVAIPTSCPTTRAACGIPALSPLPLPYAVFVERLSIALPAEYGMTCRGAGCSGAPL